MIDQDDQTESIEDHTEQVKEFEHINTPFPMCAKCGSELEVDIDYVVNSGECYFRCCECGTKNFVCVVHKFSTQIDE